jgi:hypothetical protein
VSPLEAPGGGDGAAWKHLNLRIHEAVADLLPSVMEVVGAARTAGIFVASVALQQALRQSGVIGHWGRYNPRNWYGHDMTRWPSSGIVGRDCAATFSWLYMPILLEALGIDAFPFPMVSNLNHGDVIFRAQSMWSHWTVSYENEFARRGITREQVVAQFDGNFHLPAKTRKESPVIFQI